MMINDVTYLMDESLSELTQIFNIQFEMENKELWASKTPQYRREREGTLRQLERHASGYTTLCQSTLDLLKIFTAETKAPFMIPEIVSRLAPMLDYNLEALVGPRYSDLNVKNPEKYKFNPRQLLSDMLQVFLNLTEEEEFVKAVAEDQRSYKRELFEQAAYIATKRTLKSETEVAQLLAFMEKVELKKESLEAEDDIGEVPDEFLGTFCFRVCDTGVLILWIDPLMYTLMKNPVTLPSSRAVLDLSTIKSHLLSDSKDPFNRVPLSIEDVVPGECILWVPTFKVKLTLALRYGAERKDPSVVGGKEGC